MTLTQDFTFKLGDSGVILNTDTSGTPFVDIEHVSGLDSAPFRETIRDHEGTDGGFIDAEFEKGREISLEGTIYCDEDSVESYLDTLKSNYGPSTTVIPFYLLSDASVTERLLYVKPRGIRYNWDALRRLGMTSAQFLLYAEDPRIYDSTETTTIIPFGSQVYTGFGFSLEFSFGFGGTSGTTDGANVTNNGNRPTPATLSIVGPVTNPQVINDAVSKTLTFNIDLASSDTLTVDLAAHTVLLNGVTNRRDILQEPNWFLLEAGINFIRFRGTAGSAPAALTVRHRSAYR